MPREKRFRSPNDDEPGSSCNAAEVEAEPELAQPVATSEVATPPDPLTSPLLAGASVRGLAIVAGAALVAITTLVYANAGHDTLVVDDASFPPPDQVSRDSLLQVFREDVWAPTRIPSGVYRPLAMALVQLESLAWGKYLPAYHFTLVAVHIATTLMVFALIRALFTEIRANHPADARRVLAAAWFGAALFAVHPIHTEAVNSIFNGSEVLATLGVVTGLWIVVTRHTRRPWLTWLPLCVVYLAALLCKESAATLPVLAAIVLRCSDGPVDQRRWQRLSPLAWMAIPLAVAIGLRYAAIGLGGVTATQTTSTAHAAGAGWTERLELLVTSLRDFLRMIVWPNPLRASYDDYVAHGVGNALLLLALVVGIAVWSWQRAPLITVGIAFFYIALLPSSRLLSHLGIVVTLAERYLYLPSVGVGLAFAGLLELAARRWRRTPWALSMLVCVVFGYLTVVRNHQWRSDVALWEAEVAAAPQNGDAWKWLTAAYINTRRTADAGTLCDRELPRHSDPGFQLNCGSVYLALGQRRRAETAFRAGLDAGGATAHLQLARFLAGTGRASEADSVYEAAVALENDPVRMHTIRGEQLRKLHPDRLAESQAEYEAALAIEPRFQPARNGLNTVSQMRSANP